MSRGLPGIALRGKLRCSSSEECTKSEKRRRARASRPTRDQVCRCGQCGKEVRGGRRRLDDGKAGEFVRGDIKPDSTHSGPTQGSGQEGNTRNCEGPRTIQHFQ